MTPVSFVLPTFNEEAALPATLAALARLDPPAAEVILVDGASTDKTCTIAEAAGIRIVHAPRKGRGSQINHGVRAASSQLVCIVHADTALPRDAVAVIRTTMADPRTVLASFLPRVTGQGGTRWGSTLHNWAKTWYIPLLAMPGRFFRGARLLYGDHAMFFRRAEFLAVGGCDEDADIMEEAGLCLKFCELGRTCLVHRWVRTSDRRIAALGRWRANWLYFKVGMLWALGKRRNLADHYPDIR